jgi:hypothetical protein
MGWAEDLLFLAGAVLLAVGYRRNNRNLMAGAALGLVLSAGLGDFVAGVIEGYERSEAAHRQ